MIMGWKKITFDKRQFAWHVAAIVLFYALANALLIRFFDGYQLMQPDIIQYRGMSHETASHRLLSGETSDWSNSMFGGMPTYQSGGGDKGFTWAKDLQRNYFQLFFKSADIGIMFTAMLAGYLLALALGFAPWWAAIAGVSFGLSTICMLYLGAGHRSKVNAISLMPGILAGLLWAYRGYLWRGVFLVTIFTSIHLAANHLQMTYYLLILLGLIVLANGVVAFRSGKIKSFLRVTTLVAVGGISAAAPNLSNILDTQDYSKFTTRGKSILDYDEDGNLKATDGSMLNVKDLVGIGSGENSGEGLGNRYILEYSMAPMEWLAAMCPDFKGGAAVVESTIKGQVAQIPVYWGEQKYSAGAFYFGAIVMVLFIMFLLIGKHWLRWPFLITTLLAVILSWRQMTWVMQFFLDYVPLYNKFRDTKMMLVLVQLISGAGALLMVRELVEAGANRVSDPAGWQRKKKAVLGILGGLLGLFLIFYLFPKSLFEFKPAIREDRIARYLPFAQLESLRVEVFRADVLRTMGLILVAGGAAWLLLLGKVKSHWIALVLLVIHTGDLWTVEFRYHSNEIIPGQRSSWVASVDYEYPYTPEPAHLKVLNKELSELKNKEGFLKAKETLLDAYIEKFPRRLRSGDREFLETIASFEALRAEGELFRVLHYDSPYSEASTSYFFQSVGGYHGAKLQRYQDFMEILLADEMVGVARAHEKGVLQEGLYNAWGHRMLNTRYILVNEEAVFQIPDPAGPAWFVQEVDWVKTANDEVIKTKALKSFDRAIVHEVFREKAVHVGPPGANAIELVKHDPEEVVYDVTSENGGIMICSEVYYPKGWKAFIDGEPAPIHRANFLFRAISVPPGAHRVEMKFIDEKQSRSIIALSGGVFSLLFMLFAMAWSFREEGQGDQ